MIGYERGVSGAPFGEVGVGSPFLVYPPSPLNEGFWGGLTEWFFLVTWNNGISMIVYRIFELVIYLNIM